MWIVVCPFNVIALEIKSVLDQAAFPAGMITVSPSTAEPMALLTSKREGLRAVMLFACAGPEAAKSTAARSALSFLPLRVVPLRAAAGGPYGPEGTASFARSRNGEAEGQWRAARLAAPLRASRSLREQQLCRAKRSCFICRKRKNGIRYATDSALPLVSETPVLGDLAMITRARNAFQKR